MIIQAVPREVEEAFRARLDLPPDQRAVAWVVWALSSRSLHRPAGAARRVGYQYVPLDCDHVRILEAPLEIETGIHLVNGILSNKVRSALQVTFEIAGTERRNASWELRSLRIPALYLEAMWLHSLSGLADIVVPYSSYDEDIREDQRYQLRTFLALAAKASTRLTGTQQP